MNDLNLLSERLEELAQHAPASIVDPRDDIRRGQRALHRRRARGVAGVTTAVVAVGIAARVALPDSSSGPAGGGHGGTPSEPVAVASSTANVLCLNEYNRLQEFNQPQESRPSLPAPRRSAAPRPSEHPAVKAQLTTYRQAAAEILDPSGRHLDAEVTGIQFACDMASSRLTSLGTKLGWTSSGALGVVQLEVVSPDHDQDPQIVINHDHWSEFNGNLPSSVVQAWTRAYPGGRAVYVKRQDGLTVAVDASGSWENNAPVGSPAAGDLPSVDQLLQLAGSEALSLPED